MYHVLLFLHGLIRWFALLGLAGATVNAIRGYFFQVPYRRSDDRIRHISATLLHVQLTIGLVLYFISPFVKTFWHDRERIVYFDEGFFFAGIHSAGMFIAVLLVTYGSAHAKRMSSDAAKFRIMVIFYPIALFIILLMIPWPFSPWAGRPLLRSY